MLAIVPLKFKATGLADRRCRAEYELFLYVVSLQAEVPEVEGSEDASSGPSSGLHHCLKVYIVEEL